MEILKSGKTIAGGKTAGNGHNALENDFFVVGAKHENGMVYFKLAIPEEGFSTSNAGLIRSLKNGIGGFSIVAYVEEREEGGKVFFDKEHGVPRLDYVDQGAMPQVNFNSATEREIFEAIREGRVDLKNRSDKPMVDGIVFRRWAIENQSTEHKRLAGRMLNEMAKEKNKTMTKEEILEALKNLISTGAISADEVLALVNKKAKNEEDEAKVETLEDVAKAVGLPVDAEPEKVLEIVEALVADVVEGEIDEVAETNEKTNTLRAYVSKEFKNAGYANLEKAKKALETDAVYLELKNKAKPAAEEEHGEARPWRR